MNHKRSIISIAMAALVLVSFFAVISSSPVSVSGQASGSTAPLVTSPPVGIAAGTGPAVCSWGSGRIDLFVQGGDHALWHKKYDDKAWSGWESLGGYLTSSPAATSPAKGTIDVFGRGGVALWQRTYSNGEWQPWSSLGGQMAPGTGPAAASGFSTGRLDVFVKGMDNALWHRVNIGTWSSWESLGGRLTSSPAAAVMANGQVDVFVRGGDGALWSRFYPHETGWSTWMSAGGQVAPGTGPTLCIGLGNPDLYVQGMDHALWCRFWDGFNSPGGWTAWKSLGGYLTSSPAATAPSSGKIDVFVRGADGSLWQDEYYNKWSWSGPINGP